jgi:hypothetical protein
MKSGPVLIGVVLLALGALAMALAGSEDIGKSFVFTQVPYRQAAHGNRPPAFLLDRAAAKGSRICLLASSGELTVLTPEFAAASDPSVSFDGKHVVFAGKHSLNEHWNIWEMSIDGGNKRQITRDTGNCREPEYLATSSITPPDFTDRVRWITFVSDASGAYGEGSTDLLTSLYAANTEPIKGRGTVTWRTTFNLSGDFSPTVLQDGRVVFTSTQLARHAPGAGYRFLLLATSWDGTGLNLFTGDAQGGAFKTMAVETPDRYLVFVESADALALGGRLARVSFRRPLHSHELLSSGGGYYLNPRPLADGRLAVSYTSGKESYGLYYFDPTRHTAGVKLYDDPEWEDLDAQAVEIRPEPTGLISSVVERLDWGDLHCISVYDSDRPEVVHLNKGDVKQVRLVEGMPVPAAAQPPAIPPRVRTKVLGEAPVEPDGSFFVRIPGDTPFYMELLDGQGKVLESMTRWIWVRKGTSRGCIGCHENKELAPVNVTTDAVRKGEPHDLRGSR